jgi:hypothetical protein
VSLIASAAGWREDTLSIVSVPLAERAVDTLFVEDWRRGLDTARWRSFGDPRPLTRGEGGPDGSGVFANNGDIFFASGANTTDRFPLRQGPGVEVDGRAPFTSKLHQEFGVALYRSEEPDSLLVSGQVTPVVEFRVVGPSGEGPGKTWITAGGSRVELPLLERPEDWHAYALQVQRDGTVELIVDGHLLWRSTQPLARRSGSVRVGLGFESFQTACE